MFNNNSLSDETKMWSQDLTLNLVSAVYQLCSLRQDPLAKRAGSLESDRSEFLLADLRSIVLISLSFSFFICKKQDYWEEN